MILQQLCRSSGLQYILDRLEPKTPFGAELCRCPALYTDEAALQEELARLRTLLACGDPAGLSRQLERPMMCVRDIRASLRRCAAGVTLELTELFEMKGLLLALEQIRGIYDSCCALEGLRFSDCAEALAVLDPRGERKRSFAVEDAATPALFSLRREKRGLEARLYRESDDARRSEILLQRSDICARESAEERAVCAALSARLAPFCPGLLDDCQALGQLDLLLCKASMVDCRGAAVPTVCPGELCFENMTNPAVSASVEERGGSFTPISLCLAPGATVITGANMGGKTVALKTLALNTLLAMAGYPVCAESAALPFIKNVILLSGDAENGGEGLSSFGGEIVRLRRALEGLENTLLLLDEPARGTNPDEGAAIVRGLTAYLNGQNAFSVVATHYDGVSAQAGRHYRIIGLRDMDSAHIQRELAALPEPDVSLIERCMNYGLYRCGENEDCPRQALEICRLLGLPEDVTACIDKFFDV